MNDEVFAARLEEAKKEIATLPADQRAQLEALVQETHDRHHQMKSDFSRLRRALDDWRVQMKYITFDLEATRRELNRLRRQQGNGGTDNAS